MSKKNEDVMKLVLNKLDKLDEKLDKANEKVSEIDKTLARNTDSLAEHMRRTSLLEDELKPIKKHMALFEAGLKILGVLSVVTGLAAGVLKLLGLM